MAKQIDKTIEANRKSSKNSHAGMTDLAHIALAKHSDELGLVDTANKIRVREEPMSRDEGVMMSSMFPFVAGYVVVSITDMVGHDSEEDLKKHLSKKLVKDLDLYSIEMELVWCWKERLIVYVSGNVEQAEE